jgi:hypothetical protein
MRMAGRFRRCVRGRAKKKNLPVMDCVAGERKHDIGEERLPTDPQRTGIFLLLVNRGGAVWEKSPCEGAGSVYNCSKFGWSAKINTPKPERLPKCLTHRKLCALTPLLQPKVPPCTQSPRGFGTSSAPRTNTLFAAINQQ